MWEWSDSLTHRAGSSSALQLGGGLQAAVLLPVVPAGGAQSTLHVGRSPGVPLLRLSCCGGPEENSALTQGPEADGRLLLVLFNSYLSKTSSDFFRC